MNQAWTAHPEEKGRALYIGVCVAPKGMIFESFWTEIS